jgi:hypothetical protein
MLKSNFGRALVGILATSLFAITYVGCNGNGRDTSGDSQSDVVGQFVSDGGAGATLTINATGPIAVGQRISFTVTALDPSGLPLSFIRISCESEEGIAILEPSRNGVAFESTGAGGVMSGVLGGLVPGSYVLECRGPQGFNLVDRISLLVVGSADGFDGFPGAAGGELGGGLLVDAPETAGLELGDEDQLSRTSACAQNYALTLSNTGAETLNLDSVTVSVPSLGVANTTPLDGAAVAAGESVDLAGELSEGGALSGTVEVIFVVRGTTASGAGVTTTTAATYTFGDVNNC